MVMVWDHHGNQRQYACHQHDIPQDLLSYVLPHNAKICFFHETNNSTQKNREPRTLFFKLSSLGPCLPIFYRS